MMKGNMKIELINKATGQIDQVYSDNKIGDAIGELLKVYEKNNNLPLVFKHLSGETVYPEGLFQSLFGGICLFEKEMPLDQQMIPGDNPLTGVGAYGTSSGDDLTRGSYVAEESEYTDTSWKHVFEFLPSQANGKISSVCLVPTPFITSRLHGDQTYVGTTGSKSTANFHDLATKQTIDYPIFSYGDTRPNFGNATGTLNEVAPYLIFVSDDLSQYVTACIDSNDLAKMKIQKWKISSNKVDFFNKTPYGVQANSFGDGRGQFNFGLGSPAELIDEKSFTVQELFTTTRKYYNFTVQFDPVEKKLYYTRINGTSSYPGYQLSNNNTATFDVLDFSSMTPSGLELSAITQTQVTFTNATGETINFYNTKNTSTNNTIRPFNTVINSKKMAIHIYDGHLWTIGSGPKFFKVKMSDNTVVETITPTGTPFNNSYRPLSFLTRSGDMLLSENFSSSSTQNEGFVINTQTNIATRHSIKLGARRENFGLNFATNFTPSIFHFSPVLNANSTSADIYYTSVCRVYTNFLSTINNLQTPVTKTNEQSMRITYTLQKE